MANYFSTVVIDPPLPFTLDEVNKLKAVGFELDSCGEGLFYASSENPHDEEGPCIGTCDPALKGEDWCYCDRNDASWDEVAIAVIQSCLKRCGTPYATIEVSYSCSKRRPDGFGGEAHVITPTEDFYMSTSGWIGETIARLGL